MSIEPHSPSHRGEIAELFIGDAAMLPLRFARPCYTLYALTTTSLRQRASATTVPLGIVNLGASATLPPRS